MSFYYALSISIFCIVFLPSVLNTLKSQNLIEFWIILNSDILVPISWRILLEEAYKFLQFLLLLFGKVAMYKDDAPVGKTANAITVLPKTDIELYGLNVYTHATTVHCRCNVKTVPVTVPLPCVSLLNCYFPYFRGFLCNAFIVSEKCTIIPISVDYSSVFP